VLGLDIGGANLKAYDATARDARSLPFPVWKQPHALPEALRDLLASFPPADAFAVTMTAELCDCFASKEEGVRFILDSIQAAAALTPGSSPKGRGEEGTLTPGPSPRGRGEMKEVYVWTTAGRFVSLVEARADPLPAAASNWLALATFAGRFAPRGPALLVDVGSTTTDLVPLLDGVPVPAARTDFDRLATGELIYQGVRRTPVIALLHEVKLNRGYVPLAAELFATTLDVFLVLGMLPENEADCDTADGRPATIACARQRLARMLCADQEQLTKGELQSFAQQVYNRLLDRILDSEAWTRHPLSGRFQTLILSGSGECVIKSAWKGQSPGFQMVWLSDILGPEASAAACAVAVAELAVEAAAR
jgi:hypothetical protein